MSQFKTLSIVILVFISFLLGLTYTQQLQADSEDKVPAFPACTDLLANPGDQASHAEGWHQIVGGDLVWGRDEVYSVGQGNYVQCYCPHEGAEGIQTNWWRTDLTLTGWFSENGLSWNLGDYAYLAQNSNLDCSGGNGESGEVTPTPTPETTPEATPSATVAPSNTPTPTPWSNTAGAETNREDTGSKKDEKGQVSATSTTESNDDSFINELDRVKVLAATGGNLPLGQLLMFAGGVMTGCGRVLRKLQH